MIKRRTEYMKCFYKGFGNLEWMRLFFYLIVFFPILLSGQDEGIHWKEFSIGSPAMSINLPDDPEPMEVTISPSLLQVIHTYSAYQYVDNNIGMKVMIVFTAYDKSNTTDLKAFEEQMIRDLESKGASEIEFDSVPIDCQGKQCIRLHGHLQLNGIKKTFTTSIIEDESRVWKVVIYANQKGHNGKQMMESISNSISFN
jgi:hypothetical protein